MFNGYLRISDCVILVCGCGIITSFSKRKRGDFLCETMSVLMKDGCMAMMSAGMKMTAAFGLMATIVPTLRIMKRRKWSIGIRIDA